jgi:DNA polymerase-3 subunit alpha
MITYQTAWLRTHYPYEFFSASMSLEKNDTEKLAEFIIEAKSQSIKINNPDINSSFEEFKTIDDNETNNQFIEYGLSAIKNVGQFAMQELVGERMANGKFSSLENFLRRIPNSGINKRMIESLIKCGALDSLFQNRNQLIQKIDPSR